MELKDRMKRKDKLPLKQYLAQTKSVSGFQLFFTFLYGFFAGAIFMFIITLMGLLA